MGTFDYWSHFPRSRSAKAMAMFPRRCMAEELTVEQWIRRWLAQERPRWGSGMAYDVETMVNRHIVPNVGMRLVRDLSAEDIGLLTAYLRTCSGVRGRSMGAERINKILKVLRRSLQSAVKAGVLEKSPMTTWCALRTPRPEMRPFSKDELKALLNEIPKEWQPYFEFAVWTGLRPGEQSALQWADVDVAGPRPVVKVRATMDRRKSGLRRPPKTSESARNVDLVPPAVAAIEAQRCYSSPAMVWVFPNLHGGCVNVSNLTRRIYYPAIRRAGLIERPLYNLRHTFAVFMFRSRRASGLGSSANGSYFS